MSFNNWEIFKLGDLIDSISVKHKFNKEKLIFLNTSDVLEGKVLQSDYSDVKGMPGQAKKSIQKDDILFSEIRPKNKRFAYIDFEANDYVVSTKLMVLRRKTKEIDNKYLYLYLTSEKMLDYLQMIAEGRSGTFPQITFSELKSIDINLPPLEEQKAIANILSSLDEKIELNNQMNKTLEEMAQALFKRWFVDFEFPNENGEPYKSSGGEMVDSELGMIPKGWEVSTLSDLCSLETKSEKPFENKEVVYEHFSLPACDEGKLPVIEMGSEISSNKYKIDNECILISKLNPSTKRIWNPTCTTKNAICSTEFMVYKPKKVDDKDFCYEIINSDRFTEFLLANVTGSTGSRQRTQPKKTLEYKIALGDRLIITKFSNMIKPMHELVKNNIESNKVLRAKRDTLLPKLMSGEIRVTDLQS